VLERSLEIAEVLRGGGDDEDRKPVCTDRQLQTVVWNSHGRTLTEHDYFRRGNFGGSLVFDVGRNLENKF